MTNPSGESRSPHVLLVKTSSLGDVVHNFPVVSDILAHHPDAQIDWLVDEQFAALPRLHPGVGTVISVPIRRWKKQLGNLATWTEIRRFLASCSRNKYDIAIDTQGLLKSALLMRNFSGTRCGFDWHCAREPAASLLYQKKFEVRKGQHAVERNRQLVAKAFGIELSGAAKFGIGGQSGVKFEWLPGGPYAVLLHATSRADKCWPEDHWLALGGELHKRGIRSVLPWGSETERERSVHLCSRIPEAVVPPRLALADAASVLAGGCVAVGVDTGLAHLAAALDVPTIGIYTATDPSLTGLYSSMFSRNLGGIGRAPVVAEVLSEMQQVTLIPR